MRYVATLSFVSLLILTSFAAAANEDGEARVNRCQYDDPALQGYQRQYGGGMLDGVKLTEQQRQQMRDLVRGARQELSVVNIGDMNNMHRLMTAEDFDEAAVRALIVKMSQAQLDRQVEMARIRNLMYNLLTSEQKQVLNQKHLQRMQEMQRQMSMTNQWGAPRELNVAE